MFHMGSVSDSQVKWEQTISVNGEYYNIVLYLCFTLAEQIVPATDSLNWHSEKIMMKEGIFIGFIYCERKFNTGTAKWKKGSL